MDTTDALDSIRAKAEAQKTGKALTELMRAREQFYIEDGSQNEIRKEFFYRFPDASVIQVYPWGVSLYPTPMKRVPEPPAGYAYKGGAARLALGAALGFDVGYRKGRDLDLIRVGTTQDDIDVSVAQKVMKEDAALGHGVELIDSFEQYFRTRDVTINEVLYCSDRVSATFDAIYDLEQNRIRHTKFATSQSTESQKRIAAKIIRLASEQELAGSKELEIQLPLHTPLSKNAFLLHLDRALSQSGRLAELYCRKCHELGATPSFFENAKSVSNITCGLETAPKKIFSKFRNIRALLEPPKRTRIGQKRKTR